VTKDYLDPAVDPQEDDGHVTGVTPEYGMVEGGERPADAQAAMRERRRAEGEMKR
jgi:hypothetical protein